MTAPLLTDAEREEVRRMAYAGSYSQEKANRYVAVVERILAARLRVQAEQIATAIEACDLSPADAIRKAESQAPATAPWQVKGGYNLARKRAARIARDHAPKEDK